MGLAYTSTEFLLTSSSSNQHQVRLYTHWEKDKQWIKETAAAAEVNQLEKCYAAQLVGDRPASEFCYKFSTLNYLNYYINWLECELNVQAILADTVHLLQLVAVLTPCIHHHWKL